MNCRRSLSFSVCTIGFLLAAIVFLLSSPADWGQQIQPGVSPRANKKNLDPKTLENLAEQRFFTRESTFRGGTPSPAEQNWAKTMQDRAAFSRVRNQVAPIANTSSSSIAPANLPG